MPAKCMLPVVRAAFRSPLLMYSLRFGFIINFVPPVIEISNFGCCKFHSSLEKSNFKIVSGSVL